MEKVLFNEFIESINIFGFCTLFSFFGLILSVKFLFEAVNYQSYGLHESKNKCLNLSLGTILLVIVSLVLGTYKHFKAQDTREILSWYCLTEVHSLLQNNDRKTAIKMMNNGCSSSSYSDEINTAIRTEGMKLDKDWVESQKPNQEILNKMQKYENK